MNSPVITMMILLAKATGTGTKCSIGFPITNKEVGK
jgi:hypothetical protein